jgi:ribose transport system substrate-binding protein
MADEPTQTTARSRIRAMLLVAILLVGVAVALGACGDDDDENAAQDGAAAEQEGGGVVAEAQQMIDQAQEPIEFEPPGPAIDVGELRGRGIQIVSVDQRVPILALANEALAEAAEQAGIQTSLFDAQSQVNRMQQGIQQGVRGADAIILTGIPIAAVEGALEEARDTPTVAVLNNQPDPNAPGQGAGELVDATSAPDYEENGRLAAAKAVVDTDGELNAEIFNTEEITPSPDVIRGFEEILSQCDGCETNTNTTPLAEWSTELTGKAQSVVRSNPDLNYTLPIFDAMGIFITAGIRQAGVGDRVKLASINGTPAALELVLEGDIFTANAGAPVGWVGWHAADQAMRLMLGEEPGDPTIPSRLLTTENLEGVDVEDIDAPYGDPAYREGFRELWGLGGN